MRTPPSVIVYDPLSVCKNFLSKILGAHLVYKLMPHASAPYRLLPLMFMLHTSMPMASELCRLLPLTFVPHMSMPYTSVPYKCSCCITSATHDVCAASYLRSWHFLFSCVCPSWPHPISIVDIQHGMEFDIVFRDMQVNETWGAYRFHSWAVIWTPMTNSNHCCNAPWKPRNAIIS